MSDLSDLLQAARAKIETPEAWTQHAVARDRKGLSISPFSPDACQYCSFGALKAGLITGSYNSFSRAYAALFDVIGAPISVWNDHPKRTHAEVLAAFDAAIAKADAAP